MDLRPGAWGIKYGIDAVNTYGVPAKLPEWADYNMLVCIPKDRNGKLLWLLFGNPMDA